MASYSYQSKEGMENVRRARETLKPGDIVYYPPLANLLLIIENNPLEESRWCVHVWPDTARIRGRHFVFHNDWELVGHSDELLKVLTNGMA